MPFILLCAVTTGEDRPVEVSDHPWKFAGVLEAGEVQSLAHCVSIKDGPVPFPHQPPVLSGTVEPRFLDLMRPGRLLEKYMSNILYLH